MYSSPRHLTKFIRQKISRPCVSKSNLETSRICQRQIRDDPGNIIREPFTPSPNARFTRRSAYSSFQFCCIASRTIPSTSGDRTPESTESRPTVFGMQVSMEATCKTRSGHQTFKDSRLHVFSLGHNFCRPGFTRPSYHHAALPLIGTHLLCPIITIA